MVRRRWQAGLSGPATAVIVLQWVALAVVLGVTATLGHSHGWFGSTHDRELLWDDAAVVIGVILLVPLAAFAFLRRSSGVIAAVVAVVFAGLALLAIRPV